ncbi:unconventional myosin-Va-like [Clavelina lepadiformis]|uniref:unconventional myosin-Va-like n=1 Tax=Clavelina lepadiformis TaxID=159417 RepID=UPI0040429F41
MKVTEIYTKETRVWVPDVENVWRGASLQSDYHEGDKEIMVLLEALEGELEDTETKVIKLKNSSELPPLRNPDILVGENDLTSLSYLHEPAVLHNLQIRFVERNVIYTYCGIVLVAINPYEEMSIYSDDFIQLYSGRNLGEMDPHIFAIAEEAFRQMSRDERNQSIIVTGESGAGKTVSAKYAMRYFASVGGSLDESTIEQKVLASNPIMEAIGNAKTTLNDNSSRFGKYIQIGFNRRYHIIGANMRTYLLEKSRVVSQAMEERNYHIFYQLCSCADYPQFQPLKLRPASHFEYTRIGNCIEIDGVDDRQEFQETVHALTLLGVSSKHQSLVFRLLSSILHLGNIDIEESENNSDSCFVKLDDESLLAMCELLGIESQQMAHWFCNKKITTMAEVLVSPLTYDQAMFARDALAKHMYAKLFEWLVMKVNNALVSSADEHSFIGVLDIYGFETFEVNSFEQFCINYANEKLQQQFCQHVFKLEQEEYVREEIEWKFIDFYDNQPCIALIENKLGILDLLNDECRMPRGSDQSWVQKLYDRHLKKSKHFDKSKLSNTSFFVVHFADKVRYEMEGFLEKNRDTVREEQLNILKASQFELVSELFMERDQEKEVEVKAGVGRHGAMKAKVTHSTTKPLGPPGQKRKETRRTVASQFQDSLGKLMATLNSTTPHYVRCVKPNDFKLSFTFDAKRAVQQLRACGVLETIRISAAGYPSRWTYPEFYGRYRVLMKSNEITKKNYRKTCEDVLARLIPEPDKYQSGKTKIFFRAGQVAYLEKLRADKLRICAVLIQKSVRGWLQRTRYVRMQRAAVTIQRFARGYQARCLAKFLRRTDAATVIQTQWRCYVKRQHFIKVRSAAIKIQSFTRGMFGRKYYMVVLRQAKAILIQRYVRGYLARVHYQRDLRSIIYLQCCVRRMRAKRELKVLKIEARSVDHFKKLNKGMENKIMELQRKLDVSVKENHSLIAKSLEVGELRRKVEATRENQSIIDKLQIRITELETEVTEVRNLLSDSQAETKIALESLEKERYDKDEVILGLQTEKDSLEGKNKSLETEMQENETRIKKECDETIITKCRHLEQELEDERSQHQARIKDYNRLEQRYDNIKDELEMMRNKDSSENQEASFSSLRPNSSDVELMLLNGDAEVTGEEKKEQYPELQEKIKMLEAEKSELEQRILSRVEVNVEYAGQVKARETLQQNQQLRNEINNLRQLVGEKAAMTKDSDLYKEMVNQMEAMEEELAIRRNEVIQLKSYLAKHPVTSEEKETMTSAELLGSRNRMEDISIEKLDKNELKAVLVKVYDHNRMLEAELEAEKRNHEFETGELRESIKHLTQKKQHGPFDVPSIEGNLQQELSRLSNENMELLARVESMDKLNRKLKRQLKLYSRKLNTIDAHGNVIPPESASTITSQTNPTLTPSQDDSTSVQSHPVLRHKDSVTGGALGMVQYKAGDEAKIIQGLILELQPRGVAVNMIPGLPAYLLFKLLRFADYSNDDKMIKQLLQHIINGIKKVEKKHDKDFEYISFWLANTCRFLHNMKQYSGEEEFMRESTEGQKRHCLRNFDLAEYRPVFSDIAVSLFQRLILIVEHKIKPMIVPAMLEHDTIQGLSSSVKPSGMRGRSSSRDETSDSHYTVEIMLKQLTVCHNCLLQHGTDPTLVTQIFRQVFYSIVAHTLNNQLVRKELCNWSKAMQIRYNVSQLEEWIRKHNLGESSVLSTLDPLVHASQLLQVKKSTDGDAEEICEMCTSLNSNQIVKLLQMITPTNDYEERVPVKFVKSVQAKLRNKKHQVSNDSLLLDTSRLFGVTFSYCPSSLALEQIAIPDNLRYVAHIKAV